MRQLHADPHSPAPTITSEGALGSYLRAVRAHPLVVALVTLAALAGAIAWLMLRAPTYEATAHVLVNPLPQDDQVFLGLQVLRESGEPTRTVQTAATLLESRQAADRAARALKDGTTGQAVLNSIEVEPQGESNVLGVTATANNSKKAARTANEFAAAALGIRNDAIRSQTAGALARARAQLAAQADSPDSAEAAEAAQRVERLENARTQGDPTLTLAQPATEPLGPVGAGPPLVLALALLAGLTLGSGAAVLMELLERRIRTEDELLGLYPLPILGRVPLLSRRQLQAPANGSIWYMPPSIREGFRALIAQLTGAGRQEGGRAIMLTSSSTGDGKTTSAVNLAVALAAAGKRVVLLDFDIRKPDVGRELRMEVSSTLLELLDRPLADLLRQAPGIPSLAVLPTGTAQGDLAVVDAMNRRLPDFVTEARELADFVVIDTAPLGEISDALRITHMVDDIVVVARPGHSNRTNLLLMRDNLERIGRSATGYLVIGEAAGAAQSYYGYGTAGRPLVTTSGELAQIPPR